MKKTIINTVNARIDEILATRDVELADAEKALADATASMADAQNRAKIAISAGDIDCHNAACEDEEKAKRAMKMHQTRVDQLRGTRLASVAENARTVAEIRAYQKDLQDNATAAIVDLLSQIEVIGQTYIINQNEANELIARWHRQAYQQPHPRNANLPVHVLDLYAQDSVLRTAIHSIVTGYFYRDQKGLPPYRGVGSIWTR